MLVAPGYQTRGKLRIQVVHPGFNGNGRFKEGKDYVSFCLVPVIGQNPGDRKTVRRRQMAKKDGIKQGKRTLIYRLK